MEFILQQPNVKIEHDQHGDGNEATQTCNRGKEASKGAQPSRTHLLPSFKSQKKVEGPTLATTMLPLHSPQRFDDCRLSILDSRPLHLYHRKSSRLFMTPTDAWRLTIATL